MYTQIAFLTGDTYYARSMSIIIPSLNRTTGTQCAYTTLAYILRSVVGLGVFDTDIFVSGAVSSLASSVLFLALLRIPPIVGNSQIFTEAASCSVLVLNT